MYIDDKILDSKLPFTCIFWINLLKTFQVNQIDQKFKFIFSNQIMQENESPSIIRIPSFTPNSIVSDSLYIDELNLENQTFLSTGYRILNGKNNIFIEPMQSKLRNNLNVRKPLLEKFRDLPSINLPEGRVEFNLPQFYNFLTKNESMTIYENVVYLPYVVSRDLLFVDNLNFQFGNVMKRFGQQILTADGYLFNKDLKAKNLDFRETVALILANIKNNNNFRIIKISNSVELQYCQYYHSDLIINLNGREDMTTDLKLSYIGIYNEIYRQARLIEDSLKDYRTSNFDPFDLFLEFR